MDPLLDQICADAESIFEDGQPEVSVMQAYYRRLTDSGQTDAEAVVDARRSMAMEDLKRTVRREGDVETVDETLGQEYDERILAQARRTLRRQGVISRGDHRYYYHGG